MFRNRFFGGGAVAATLVLAGCVQTADIDFVEPERPLVTVSRAEQCAPVVDRQVDALGLSGRVESITYVDDRLRGRGDDDDDFDILRSVVAWVDVSDCQGYVVIDMRATCRIKQIYARGECTVPTAPAG